MRTTYTALFSVTLFAFGCGTEATAPEEDPSAADATDLDGKADGITSTRCEPRGTPLPASTATPSAAVAPGCSASNDCRLARDVPAASQRVQEAGGLLVSSYIPLDPSRAEAAGCIDPNVAQPTLLSSGVCYLMNMAFPVVPLREYIGRLPARLRPTFVTAASAGLKLVDPLVERMAIWTGFQQALTRIFSSNVMASTTYSNWHSAFAPEESVALASRYDGGATAASPATYQTFADPQTLGEQTRRNLRSYCTFKAAQARRASYNFKAYDIKFKPFFGETPILKFQPVLTIEHTENGPTGDGCGGLATTIGGRQGMRVQVFGADFGDLTGPWVMNQAEADVTEGTDKASFYRSICDDAGRNCKSVLGNNYRKYYRRVETAATMSGASGKGHVEVRVPVHKTPISTIYANLFYDATYGRASLAAPEPEAFPSWTSSSAFSPGVARTPSTPLAGLMFPGPAPLNAPVRIFDGAFQVARSLLFSTPGTRMPQAGRGPSGYSTLRAGADAVLERIAANDDKTMRFGADTALRIGLSGQLSLKWIGVELGGNVGIEPRADLDVKEQLTGIETYPRSDMHATSWSFSPSATLRGVLGLWADVWLHIDLGLFSIDWRRRVVNWTAPFAQDTTPPADELDRLRLTTWTDAPTDDPTWGPIVAPAQLSHLPRTAPAATTADTFLPQPPTSCLSGTVDTPVPPAAPGSCNGATPGLQIAPCIMAAPQYRSTLDCRPWTAMDAATADATVGGRVRAGQASESAAACMDLERWFVCRGVATGMSHSQGPIGLQRWYRSLDGSATTEAEIRVLLRQCTRALAVGMNKNPDDRAVLEPLGQMYVDQRVNLCGSDGLPLPTSPTAPVLGESSPICGG